MDIKKDQVYRHFKGNIYRVLTLAKHTETGEEMVVYEHAGGDHEVYVRPRDLFESPVNKIKYPDADQEMRFKLLTDEEAARCCLNPLVEQFLDAEDVSDRIDILQRLHPTVTIDDIDIMSRIMDIEFDENMNINARYELLMNNLKMRDRFGASRLRR